MRKEGSREDRQEWSPLSHERAWREFEPKMNKLVQDIFTEHGTERTSKIDDFVQSLENADFPVFDFMPTSFADFWRSAQENMSEEQRGSLKEKIEGTTMIDLGGGNYPNRMTQMATEYDAENYISIDKFHLDDRDVEYDPEDMESDPMQEAGGIHAVRVGDRYPLRPSYYFGGVPSKDKAFADYVLPGNEGKLMIGARDDLLRALSKISSSKEGLTFVLNGIDRAIIANEEYHKLLAEELARVVPPTGIVLSGTESVAVEYMKDDFDIQEVDETGRLILKRKGN